MELSSEKEDLIEQMTRIVGHVPIGTRDLLNVLIHPDLIEYTKKYINAQDEGGRCLFYEYPWSCAKEAEANYKNIKYGWLGGASGIGFDETWCDNCRKKIMEE